VAWIFASFWEELALQKKSQPGFIQGRRSFFTEMRMARPPPTHFGCGTLILNPWQISKISQICQGSFYFK
jgi:hypothetical protein